MNDALRRASEPIDGTSEFQAESLDYLNRGYSGLATGTLEQSEDTHVPWWWLWAPYPGIITLLPSIGSWTHRHCIPDRQLRHIQRYSHRSSWHQYLPAGLEYQVCRYQHCILCSSMFRISAHTAGSTTFVLDSPYTGPNATVAFKAYKLTYDCPSDLLYISAPLRAYQTGKEKVNVISKQNMESMFPLTQITFGIPTDACFVAEQKLRFSHYVGDGTTTKYVRVDFDYVRMPPTLVGSSTEEPLVPLNYRSILADFCLQEIYIAKNDDRAAGHRPVDKGKINGMRREHMARMGRTTANLGRVFARQQIVHPSGDRGVLNPVW